MNILQLYIFSFLCIRISTFEALSVPPADACRGLSVELWYHLVFLGNPKHLLDVDILLITCWVCSRRNLPWDFSRKKKKKYILVMPKAAKLHEQLP